MNKLWINLKNNWFNRFLIILIFLLLQFRPMQALVRSSALIDRFVLQTDFPIFWDFNFHDGQFWLPEEIFAILFMISLITIFVGTQENSILWIVGFHGLALLIFYPLIYFLRAYLFIKTGGFIAEHFGAFTISFLYVWILTGLLIINILRNIKTDFGKNQSVGIRLKELLRDDKLKLWYWHSGYIVAGIFIGSSIPSNLIFGNFPYELSTYLLYKNILQVSVLVIASIPYLYSNRDYSLQNFGISFYILFNSILVSKGVDFFVGLATFQGARGRFLLRAVSVLLLTYLIGIGKNYLNVKKN